MWIFNTSTFVLVSCFGCIWFNALFVCTAIVAADSSITNQQKQSNTVKQSITNEFRQSENLNQLNIPVNQNDKQPIQSLPRLFNEEITTTDELSTVSPSKSLTTRRVPTRYPSRVPSTSKPSYEFPPSASPSTARPTDNSITTIYISQVI